MEILANELAKLLNITVEKAIELYPVLKQQFVQYNIIGSVSFIFLVMFWTSLVSVIALGFVYLFNIEYINSDSKYDKTEKALATSSEKILPKVFIFLAVGVVGISITSILQYLLSPDFMLIKDVLMK